MIEADTDGKEPAEPALLDRSLLLNMAALVGLDGPSSGDSPAPTVDPTLVPKGMGTWWTTDVAANAAEEPEAAPSPKSTPIGGASLKDSLVDAAFAMSDNDSDEGDNELASGQITPTSEHQVTINPVTPVLDRDTEKTKDNIGASDIFNGGEEELDPEVDAAMTGTTVIPPSFGMDAIEEPPIGNDTEQAEPTEATADAEQQQAAEPEGVEPGTSPPTEQLEQSQVQDEGSAAPMEVDEQADSTQTGEQEETQEQQQRKYAIGQTVEVAVLNPDPGGGDPVPSGDWLEVEVSELLNAGYYKIKAKDNGQEAVVSGKHLRAVPNRPAPVSLEPLKPTSDFPPMVEPEERSRKKPPGPPKERIPPIMPKIEKFGEEVKDGSSNTLKCKLNSEEVRTIKTMQATLETVEERTSTDIVVKISADPPHLQISGATEEKRKQAGKMIHDKIKQLLHLHSKNLEGSSRIKREKRPRSVSRPRRGDRKPGPPIRTTGRSDRRSRSRDRKGRHRRRTPSRSPRPSKRARRMSPRARRSPYGGPRPCRYGDDCQRVDCYFAHPTGDKRPGLANGGKKPGRSTRMPGKKEKRKRKRSRSRSRSKSRSRSRGRWGGGRKKRSRTKSPISIKKKARKKSPPPISKIPRGPPPMKTEPSKFRLKKSASSESSDSSTDSSTGRANHGSKLRALARAKKNKDTQIGARVKLLLRKYRGKIAVVERRSSSGDKFGIRIINSNKKIAIGADKFVVVSEPLVAEEPEGLVRNHRLPKPKPKRARRKGPRSDNAEYKPSVDDQKSSGGEEEETKENSSAPARKNVRPVPKRVRRNVYPETKVHRVVHSPPPQPKIAKEPTTGSSSGSESETHQRVVYPNTSQAKETNIDPDVFTIEGQSDQQAPLEQGWDVVGHKYQAWINYNDTRYELGLCDKQDQAIETLKRVRNLIKRGRFEEWLTKQRTTINPPPLATTATTQVRQASPSVDHSRPASESDSEPDPTSHPEMPEEKVDPEAIVAAQLGGGLGTTGYTEKNLEMAMSAIDNISTPDESDGEREAPVPEPVQQTTKINDAPRDTEPVRAPPAPEPVRAAPIRPAPVPKQTTSPIPAEPKPPPLQSESRRDPEPVAVRREPVVRQSPPRRPSTSRSQGRPQPQPETVVVPARAPERPESSSGGGMDSDVEQWTKVHVGKWLINLGGAYTNYVASFNTNGVTGSDLITFIDEPMLRELGVNKMFHIRKILNEIKKLKAGPQKKQQDHLGVLLQKLQSGNPGAKLTNYINVNALEQDLAKLAAKKEAAE